MRRRTGLRDLPVELTGLILEHLIFEINIDQPEDIERWSYNSSTGSPSSSTARTVPRPTKPYPYYSDQTLCSGERLNSSIKVLLRARLNHTFQWQIGDLTVMIPRRWNELLHSGIFSDCDMAFFGRKMDIEVTYMRARRAPYIVYGPDTRTESTVRDLLAWTQSIRVYDLRLHAINVSPEDLACYLPRLQRLDIFHEGWLPWIRPHNAFPTYIGSHMDPRALRVITEEEVHGICSAGSLPDGLLDILRIRDRCLNMLAKLNLHTAMPTGQIAERLRRCGWTGKTRHCVSIKCIAEGSKWWSGLRIAFIAVVLDYDWNQGWVIDAIAVSGDSFPDSDTWASLLHFNV